EEAKAAGVTVIAYDRLVTGTDAVDYYVTFDSFAVGVAQGTYIIENVGDGKNIPLYLYAGAVTDNNAYLYFKGAWSVLQPKIADKTFKIANSSEAIAFMDKQELTDDELGKIMNEITTEWNFDSAKSKAEVDLAAVGNSLKGDIAVLAPNDGVARSLADVYEAAKAVSSFVITGMDSEKTSVQYVIDGKQSMTIFKDTRVLVADSVAMAVSILDGEKPVTDTVYNNGTKEVPTKQTDIVVVTRDNVKKALIDSGYYKLSDFEGIE
ncbi:MAG: substrate-binding domain-containing protein, partial [Lachnospiraceae bacterium]|nr:substrate-binding domain-containing protein [Lachnospiraceae bacterium]